MRPGPLRSLFIILLASLVVVGGASAQPQQDELNLPELGPAGSNVITPQQEAQLGRSVVANIRNQHALLEDPLVTAYIQDVGHRLSSHSDRPDLDFTFFVVNDDDINAFALPGGFIGVNSGLITYTDNEDELAGVMAHEISHITQRHIARQMEGSKLDSLGALAGLLGAIIVGSHNANAGIAAISAAQAGIAQHQLSFTRANESEADRVGIKVLARAGFSPEGMVSFFEKMQQQYRLLGYNMPEFLSSHPLDLTRITEAKNRARQYHVPPHADSHSYALMKARIRVLTSTDIDETLRYFRTSDPENGSWTHRAYIYGEALCLTRQAHPHQAIKLIRGLLKHDDVLAFHVALADAQIAAGQTKAGLKTFAGAAELFSGSYPLTLMYAKALLDVGQPQRARTMLESLFATHKPDTGDMQLLAQAAGNSGEGADAHYYMSRYYAMSFKFGDAATQLQLALHTPGIDAYQRARYQAQLDQLRRDHAKDIERDETKRRRGPDGDSSFR